MINALSQEVDGRHSALAYFYCDYADQETLDASVVLATIIQQLLIVRPIIEDVIAAKIREAYGDGMRNPSPGDLIKILEYIIQDYQRVYIVLDGVDEASQDTQEKIFANFATLTVSQLERLNVSVNVISEDIEHYIKASVQARLHHLPVVKNYPYLKQELFLSSLVKRRDCKC